MAELLDFKDRQDFSFLQFDEYAKKDVMTAFIHDCQKVVEYAHDTVKSLCLIGLRLKRMQQSPGFSRVLDVNGENYTFNGFADFCAYAFGFSPTRTSNLLALADFVKMDGENVDFIDVEYSRYSISQLIELSSVHSWNRRYFSDKMTIKDMRLVKKLLKTAGNSSWTPEDALCEAKRRFDPPKVEHVDEPKPLELKSDVGYEPKSSDVVSLSSALALLSGYKNWKFFQDVGFLKQWAYRISFGDKTIIAIESSNWVPVENDWFISVDYYIQLGANSPFWCVDREDLAKWLFEHRATLFPL